VTGFLFALCFALGLGLLVFGARLEEPLRRLIARQRGAVAGSWRRALLASVLAAVAAAVAWAVTSVFVLALVAAAAAAYVPVARLRRKRTQDQHERERAWPAALAQLADALEAGVAVPAAVSLLAESGPAPLRSEFLSFQAQLRAAGLEAALDGLARAGERTADTVALLLRAGLLELPAGGLAPVVRELSAVLAERFEAREKARSRASSLQVEAAVLALSPIVLLLLVGSASPGYLDAYRTPAGSLVAVVCGLLIFGCYLLMRRLGRVPEPRRTGARG
jgi:tight adherence protein B